MFVQKVLQGPFSFTNDDGHTYVLCRPCKVIATGNARFKRHFDMELKRDGEAVKLPGGAVWAMATVVKAGVKEKESDCTSISSNSHFEIQSGVWATCALPAPRRRRDCGHSPPEEDEPWMRMLREEMDRYTTAVKGKRRGVGKGESVAFVFDASDPKIGSILVKKVRVSAKVLVRLLCGSSTKDAVDVPRWSRASSRGRPCRRIASGSAEGCACRRSNIG